MPTKEPQMLVVDFQMLEFLGLMHVCLLPNRAGEVLKEDFETVYLHCRRHHPNGAPVYIFPLLFASDESAFVVALAIPPELVQY